MSAQVAPQQAEEIDAVVVGAGFAGLYMMYRLNQMGLNARGFEGGTSVGGTWYWNRYPGARCDVESLQYSYGFSKELAQEWEWTERYAAQPEILAYLEHTAEKFNLRKDFQFETRVILAHFDAGQNRWLVGTDRGDRFSARYCVMATGCLSSANIPVIDGQDSFKGEVYHTGKWPHHKVDFSGKRVGIIGTGSSGIQSVPEIAREAAHLTVFQRTPNFSVPARNRPMDPAFQAKIKANYEEFRANLRDLPLACFEDTGAPSAVEETEAQREARYEEYWQRGGLIFLAAYADLLTNEASNKTAAEFVRRKIREIVKDPQVADTLSPDHIIGCKRPCSDTGYYEAFNRDNVALVDLTKTPIESINETGVVIDGDTVDIDCLIYATGFDAMTGSLDRIDIRGKQGEQLKEKWAPGPQTYLGLQTAGFPNLFTITGPGSPSVLANMVTAAEQHVDLIADCIEHLREQGKSCIEPSQQAEDEWGAQVSRYANATLYPTCNSWYMGANIPGKPRVFLPYIGGYPSYVKTCEEVVADNFRGFEIS